MALSAFSELPKLYHKRCGNWPNCSDVEHLSVLRHACAGCQSTLSRLNLHLGPGLLIRLKNLKFVIFYKMNASLIRLKQFLNFVNILFIALYHRIPNITYGLSPDWLDVQHETQSGLCVLSYQNFSANSFSCVFVKTVYCGGREEHWFDYSTSKHSAFSCCLFVTLLVCKGL